MTSVSEIAMFFLAGTLIFLIISVPALLITCILMKLLDWWEGI